MKAFMADVTLIAESRSHMEQLVTRLQELLKWSAMNIKPSKCQSLFLLKGNCKEIKFSVDANEIPTIHEKSVKILGLCHSLTLTDRHCWQDLGKQSKSGLRSIDKCDLMNNDKIWRIYFGLIPKLALPLQIYEVSLTNVETMEPLICKFMKKWSGVPNPFTNVALYSSTTKEKLPKLSLVKEYKLGKALLFKMLRDSRVPGEERPDFCDKLSEKESKDDRWESRIDPLDGRNIWQCGKRESRARPTSTAFVVQRIHVKQKKNGLEINSSSCGS